MWGITTLFSLKALVSTCIGIYHCFGSNIVQVWFQNRRARSIKTGRYPKTSYSVLGGRGVVQTPSGPVTSAFLTSANMFRQEQIHSSEDVPQMYPDWIQIYNNPVSSPSSSSVLHQQPLPGCSKPSEPRLWEDDQQQRQQLAPPLTSFLPGSFPPPVSRQPHHSSSSRSFQSFRNFKAPSGPHQAMYGATAGGGHASVDQVVPSHPQPMYWEVTQGQGHHHQHPHAQVGPQTSMGYISDLIYNAAIVTNFLEF